MKRITIALLLMVLVIVFEVFSVYPAKTLEKEESSKPVLSPTPSKSKSLLLLITKAENRTQARIDDLEKLFERIDSDKRLLQDEKTSLNKEITGFVDDLEKIKDSFSLENSSKEVRDSYKGVLEEKIYAYFIPKTRIIVVISNLISLEKRFEETVSKASRLVEDFKIQGKDTEDLEENIQGLSDRLDNIKKILEEDRLIMAELTISSSYKQTFTAVRKDLAKVRSEFGQARKNLAKIKKGLKDLDESSKDIETLKSSKKPSVTPKLKI
ncbi:hypothetical protein C4577_02785 [Candidatus Parcubacteria bacterium]|nr:MAG: hypothetical protein C4577_02785 [Candidatus Parcubacteria bacterium]